MSGNREKLKIAVCQLRTEPEREATMEKTARMLREAAEEGAEIAVLPEMFCCPYSRRSFREFAQRGHRDVVQALSELARESRLYLVGGSVPETEGDALYNTCFVFDREGRQIARHRKVHLFDIDVPGIRFRESDSFRPGNAVTVFDSPWGKMGAAVCFDLRFPELFRAMALRGAQVIFLPAQFNRTTGPAHWEMALRARAVDNELFVIGASAAPSPDFSYQCWGHSTVVDPWGEIVAACGDEERVLCAELDLARVDQVRQQLPTLLHLRRDVYQVSE